MTAGLSAGKLRVTGRFGPQQSGLRRLVARDSPFRRTDWPLLLAATGLSLIGALLVYSATRGRTALTHGDPQYFLQRHLVNLVVGMVLGAGTVLLGGRRLRGVAPFVYIGSVLLLLAVLSPLGSTVNGAHSWIVLGGGFSIQPAEFGKIGMILAMAMVLAARVDAGEREHPDHRSVGQALLVALVPMVVVLAQPDLGSIMVMVVIVMGCLLASGASHRWIAGLVGAGLLGCVVIWQAGVLSQYQINRFAAFANPALDPAGTGYNTSQARIAIGSGGLLGKGLFHGTQTGGQFVPEQQTDFVFTVAGEELGFVGCLVILGLLGVVLWRACRIARLATDLYGTIVAGGIIAWIAFQAFENIGMTLGIMPVTGLPLPFVSYGGSSMFAVWIAVGLLQSIRIQRPLSA
ncbi:rod shape-determining protein RodA [Mangrovactinospora gilvigrisea]|uniref:peptidoglycan glycosyltransferase n=1 Tax=Mangrovactinospora gilvigrisea TaxID=1428644 RepID=A0A1J7CDK3_9ACTN|nr:rod shape-determining protein RodA [Mangrovactinospora gilvigrisea]OIV37738.1 rod shape-determining protein RodA [Mangrovactinospora gilvigrisea]